MRGSVIKNVEALSTSQLRRDALAILEAGYQAVLTERVVREQVSMQGNDICIKENAICLSDFERIFFVGIGKCSVDAAYVFEGIIGEHLTDGIVLDVKEGIFKRLRSYVGTHPFPSEQNISITKDILSMVGDITERDLVLVVVSGGGSSLLCLPHEMTCATIKQITEALWEKGATIGEVNTVRKHISDIQGGQLAKLLYPATVVSFIFSDVPGDDMSIVASGPTVRDTTTIEDAERILAAYDVINQCKLPDCALVETPKDDKYFRKVTNILLVTNKIALSAMEKRANALGYHATIRNTSLEGIAQDCGRTFAALPTVPGDCFLYGGETTVEVKAHGGKGGRNQEFALSAVATVPHDTIILAAASDGWDNTDVAGAIVDAGDRERARRALLDPELFLASNNSYAFWKANGGAIETGRTGINVSDFYMCLRAK
jgi:glycerate-2-kinase